MIGVAFALARTFGTDNGTERAAFEHALRGLARMRGWTLDRTRFESAVRTVPADMGPTTDLSALFSAALGPTLSRQLDGMPLAALVRMAGARCVADRFEPYADVPPTLRELTALNVPRVAVSGGWSSIEQRKAEAAGFDGPVLLAEDLDAPLSSPRMFARIAQQLALPADRIWFVGTDVRIDILPAQAAGLNTIWLNRDNAPFPLERTPPNATIQTFAGVLKALSEPYTRGSLALRYILRTVLDYRDGHALSMRDPLFTDASDDRRED